MNQDQLDKFMHFQESKEEFKVRCKESYEEHFIRIYEIQRVDKRKGSFKVVAKCNSEEEGEGAVRFYKTFDPAVMNGEVDYTYTHGIDLSKSLISEILGELHVIKD